MSAPPNVDLRHLASAPPSAVSTRRRGLLVRVAMAGLVVGVAALTLPDLVRLDHITPFAQVVSFRPFLLAALAGLVLLAAGLSWRYRVLAPAAVALLVVLALGVVMIVPRTQASPVPPGGRPLTVLAFNAENGQADIREVAELINSERPDLVALVEVGETYWRRLAPLVAPLNYQVFRARGYDADGELGGVTALASPALGDVTGTFDLSTPFPIVQVEGGELGALRFVAYHAIAPRRGDVPQWRSDLGKLRPYCSGDTPVIIAGDFNATLDHSPLRAATAGCSDAAMQRGQGLVPTWPTWMPQWFGPQIDHVFATNPIAAQRFEVREVTGSDHRALIVELRLPG